MSDKYDGGPAFPDPGRAQSEKQREKLTQTGMSLRDYFAAKAMSAFLVIHKSEPGKTMADHLSEHSYRIADAMLKARDNG